MAWAEGRSDRRWMGTIQEAFDMRPINQWQSAARTGSAPHQVCTYDRCIRASIEATAMPQMTKKHCMMDSQERLGSDGPNQESCTVVGALQDGGLNNSTGRTPIPRGSTCRTGRSQWGFDCRRRCALHRTRFDRRGRWQTISASDDRCPNRRIG